MMQRCSQMHDAEVQSDQKQQQVQRDMPQHLHWIARKALFAAAATSEGSLVCLKYVS